MERRIGIIGIGNMGEAILSQSLKLKSARIKLKPKNFIIFEKDKLRQAFVKQQYRIQVARDIIDLVGKSTIVIIAVKPQDIDEVLDRIAQACGIYKKRNVLIVSIAAGINTSYIEKKISSEAKVVRAMPNMPACIGEGITALAKGHFANNHDLNIVKRVFEVFGPTIVINKEELINAVTAISGSGPAYIFYIFSAISAAAGALQLDKESANTLIYHTIIGSMNLLKIKKFDNEALIERVASKGGTTEAALKVFREKELGAIIHNALVAAYKRAVELSR